MIKFPLMTIPLGLLMAGCGDNPPPSFPGYVEGEYLYLASPQAGYLLSLDSPRGSRAKAGQTLFAVAADPDTQALAEAEAKAASAREKVDNLKAPRRPAEIATQEAQVRSAKATLDLAETQLRQQEALARQHFVSQARLDEALANRKQAKAQLEAAEEQLATTRVTFGRQAEVRGAESDLAAAQAAAAQKRWLVERKTAQAPAAGEVSDTYYRPGEWVPAGAAVASLLPDNRRRLRFYVPESEVGRLSMGEAVEARCDGCPAPIRGTIDFIAPQAEYTPPVIYSKGSREKLVFRVEASPAPEQAAALRPGLPLDVRVMAH